MTVAAIALRACEIKNGGDRGSADFKAGKSNRGLAAFAREVGISSYSLYRWVGVRRYVYDQRKSKSEKFSFTMAHRAYSSKRTSGPDTCIELYEQMMSDPHANNKAISESNFKRIKWAHRFFNKNPPKRYLPKYMVEEAKEKLEDLVEIFS